MITRRQKEYIQYYVDTMNATKSAILAGYKEKNASSYVVRLMKNPEILAEIKRLIDKKHSITKEEYELRTLKLHEQEDNKSVKARYWELLGEVKGFRKHSDINVTIANIGEDKLKTLRNKRLQEPVNADIDPCNTPTDPIKAAHIANEGVQIAEDSVESA